MHRYLQQLALLGKVPNEKRVEPRARETPSHDPLKGTAYEFRISHARSLNHGTAQFFQPSTLGASRSELDRVRGQQHPLTRIVEHRCATGQRRSRRAGGHPALRGYRHVRSGANNSGEYKRPMVVFRYDRRYSGPYHRSCNMRQRWRSSSHHRFFRGETGNCPAHVFGVDGVRELCLCVRQHTLRCADRILLQHTGQCLPPSLRSRKLPGREARGGNGNRFLWRRH